jgi:hypothetical protein
VLTVLSQSIPILIYRLTNRIIIGIGCVRSADTKETLFFISFEWYRPGGPVLKMAYQPIAKTYSIVVHAKIKALWLGLLVAASSGGGTTGSFTKISSVVDGSH